MSTKLIVVILMGLFMIPTEGSGAETAPVMISFPSNTMAELDDRVVELERMGVRVVHIFPPTTIIGETASLPKLLKVIRDAEIISTHPYSVSGKSETRAIAAYVWNYLFEQKDSGENVAVNENDLSRSCETASPQIAAEYLEAWSKFQPNTNLANTFTSNYMVGRVAVKIALMESAGSAENWGPVFENIAIAEIAQGLDWISNTAAEQRTRLQWVYDISRSVPTDLEPIQGHSAPYYSVLLPPLSWEFLWIDDALDYFGYPSEWDGCFALAQQMRQTYHANWAFSVFVVMDNNDADHRFTNDNKYAYVMPYYDWTGTLFRKLPGCTVVMTYNNGDWGIPLMDRVMAHEVGHIFRAPDEYQVGDNGCSEGDCDKGFGYLWRPNASCEACPGEPMGCMMYDNSLWYCPFSLGHIGWEDLDADGVADALKPTGSGSGGSGGCYFAILDVSPGDLIRIFTIGDNPSFVSSHVVTDNDLAECEGCSDRFFWDGRNYDGQKAALGRYLYTVNNGSTQDILTSIIDEAIGPQVVDISLDENVLKWRLDNDFTWARVRCDIWQAGHPFVFHSRPLWDKPFLINQPNPETIDVSYLEPGTYRANFYAWRPDGGNSGIVSFAFEVQPCYWLVGDADGNGVINVSDAVYLINYIFGPCEGCPVGPPPTPHNPGSGDADCNGIVTISDAVYMITWAFGGGPYPGLTCDCSDYIEP